MSILEVIDHATRSGPAMVVGLARATFRQLLVGLFLAAALGVIVGGQIGHTATSPAEAHVPPDVLDIDIRDSEPAEPVDIPLVPDRFEQPVGSSDDAPEWYLDGIQKYLDVILDVVGVVGNATAQAVYVNDWVPLWLTQAVGGVGVFAPFAYRFVRLYRVDSL